MQATAAVHMLFCFLLVRDSSLLTPLGLWRVVLLWNLTFQTLGRKTLAAYFSLSAQSKRMHGQCEELNFSVCTVFVDSSTSYSDQCAIHNGHYTNLKLVPHAIPVDLFDALRRISVTISRDT